MEMKKMLINFMVDERKYEIFKGVIGSRKVSETLREFIYSFSNNEKDDYDELILKKRLQLLYLEKQKIDKEYFEIKNKIDIKDKIRQEEYIKMLQEDKEEFRVRQKVETETMKQNLHNVI
jgi:hypothetical protein